MPFYEYQCEKCSEIYEIFVRDGERIPESCEVCGGRLHKIISASTFHLKGSGWYITDYARKNSREGDLSKPSNNSTETSANNTVSSENTNRDKSLPSTTASQERMSKNNRDSI